MTQLSELLLSELATKVDAIMASMPEAEQQERIKQLKKHSSSLRQTPQAKVRETRQSSGRRSVSRKSA
ncbi:MAG: hypothetical protein EXQ56_05370 [Acidobacteria bacterium]|nr:hypothetical protein [Acidobacteriota bacterium]